MHVRQLESFVAVAEELHFGRAAERLHVSQPALSRQIDQLERELGARLLRRSRRRVELTAAGTAYVAELRQVLMHLERAAQTARGLSNGELGHLRVGHVDSAAYELLPRALRRLREARPGIGIWLTETGSRAVIDGLRNLQFDLGLLREPSASDDLEDVVLLDEPFVAALPEDHRAAAASSVDPSSLTQDDFVVVARQSAPAVRNLMLEICRDAGFTPSVAYEAAPLASVLPIVGAGLACALVPLALSQHMSAPGVVYLPLEGVSATLELRAAWRRTDDSPLVAALVATLAEVAADRRTPG